jgi:hypothetical protein
MSDFNITTALKDIGVSEEDINFIVGGLSGDDMLNLVLVLNKEELHDSYKQAWDILKKYDIQPKVQETLSLSSDNLPAFVKWLEENNTSYVLVENTIQLKNLSDGQIKTLIGDVMHEGKDSKKAKKELEDFLKKNPRNPYALSAKMHSGAGTHADSRKPRDTFGRDAKHKKNPRDYNEDINFIVGDSVIFENQEAVIKIPNGPNGTVGILINDDLRMVSRVEIEKLDESIIGFSPMDNIGRLKELAGIRKNSPQDISRDIDESLGDIGFDSYDGIDVDDDMDELESTVSPTIPDGRQMATTSQSSEIPAVSAPTKPISSSAYSQILDHLNNIQNCLSDIRLSEYRSLIQKLEDLSTQVKNMGRDYLGEAAKKNIR